MKRKVGMLVAASLVLLMPLVAGAQSEVADHPGRRVMQMMQVTDADRERIDGGALLIAGYAIAWALLFGFVVWTHVRQLRLARDLARLEARQGAEGPPQ